MLKGVYNALIKWLGVAGGVGWQKLQTNCSQIFDLRISWTIVYRHDDRSTLKMIFPIEFTDPFFKDRASHPGLLVRSVVNWKSLDVFEASRICRFSNRKEGQFLGSCCICGNQYYESILRLLPSVTGLTFEVMRLMSSSRTSH